MREHDVRAIAEAVVDVLQERGLVVVAATPATPAVLTAAEVADMLGVHRNWVYGHNVALGGVPLGPGGGAPWRFTLAAVEAWITDQRRRSLGPPSLPEPPRRSRRAPPTGVALIDYESQARVRSDRRGTVPSG
jgi:hypothetical protein